MAAAKGGDAAPDANTTTALSSSSSSFSRALNKTKARIGHPHQHQHSSTATRSTTSFTNLGEGNDNNSNLSLDREPRMSIDSTATNDSSEELRRRDRLANLILSKTNKLRRDSKDLSKPDAGELPEQQHRQQQQEERGRSPQEKDVAVLSLSTSLSPSAAQDSSKAKFGRSESSLVTVESESERDLAPPLVSRPSHAGYLTTSSPLIKATTSAPQESEKLALAPDEKDISRSRSPAGKLKNVFKSSPSRRTASPIPSPDRDPLEAGGGGGLASIFTAKAADSRRGSTNIEKPTLIRPSTAKGRLPAESITTEESPTTPVTTITPPTPVVPNSGFPSPPSSPKVPETNSDIVTSPSGLMISHRRSRSTPSTQPPSKLSHAIAPPLTPIDEPKSNGTSPGATGFFSTVFSAAQNVATTLGNTISVGENRSRSGTQTEEPQEASRVKEEVISNFSAPSERADSTPNGRPAQRPAVETLGLGELSLSHLGLGDSSGDKMLARPTNGVTLGSVPDRDRPTTPHKSEPAPIFESPRDEPVRMSSQTLLASPKDDASVTSYAKDVYPDSKPRSVNESGDVGTPVSGEHEVEIKRSGSVRSKVGAAARRKRGSSAGTGGTIAAAIGATNAALGHHSAQAQASVPRLTGFAVASKKRNRDFHQLFRSVPEDDYLIEDYSAAIQRDILMHGRLYVSEGHICFNANIFGWITTSVISFDEVVSIEKKSTAIIFPNAIIISTLQRRNVFASFVSRDSTYDLLVEIWKISHPNLKSSANGIMLDDSKSTDKTVIEEDSGSEISGSESEDDEMYDEDEEGEEVVEMPKSIAGSDIGEKAPAQVPNGLASTAEQKTDGDSPSQAGDFPGPSTHAPTSCSDQSSHYEKVIKDEIIAAPLGKIYNLLFGAPSGAWMSKFLLEDQKVLELQMEDDKKGLNDEIRTRNSSYIKPLNASIGPKQTKCIITENLDTIDFEKAVSVTVVTQTPDVPSGNVFSVKTKYCLTWAEGNATRLVMNCAIEWTGKSWLKTPIEKGANDGQVAYAQALFDAVRNTVVARARAATGPSRGKGKGRRRKGTTHPSDGRPRGGTDGANDSTAAKRPSNWGLLEPVRDVVEPIADIIRPLVSGNIVLGGVVILVLFVWFSSSWTRVPQSASDVALDIEALYSRREQIWRREERELWDWLDRRAGLSGLTVPRAVRPADSGGHQDMEWALSTTERQLERMRRAVASGEKKKN
ncbi:MAG: hypothetical protein M1814_005176 [Vezdaea aestivalis]|nr:MAG: hypothetical protein M1814_005176 [Vezdaea aestivalis]